MALTRSETMARVKARDTTPERVIRQLLTKMGYRYRLHRRDIPGNPDIAFIGRRKAIFVHGCFWHGHGCARGARVPKTNTEYWIAKIGRNRSRDATNLRALEKLGWSALAIWECEIKDMVSVRDRLLTFLGERR